MATPLGAMDIKHLTKPPTFDGSKATDNFRDWKFKMENYLMLVDSEYIAKLTMCETINVPIGFPTGQKETDSGHRGRWRFTRC